MNLNQYEYEARIAARDARNCGFLETANAMEELADEIQFLALQQVMDVPPTVCFRPQAENLH